MSERRFTRRTEDFVCGHCARAVRGSGYTNHCPRCLWSRHVDVMPGDRSAECGGLMEPVGTLLEDGEFVVVQRCVDCGHMRPNRAAPNDDRDAVIALSGRMIEWPPDTRKRR